MSLGVPFPMYLPRRSHPVWLAVKQQWQQQETSCKDASMGGKKENRKKMRGKFILEHSILNTFSICKLPSRRFSTVLSLSSTLYSLCCVCSSNSILSPSLKSTNSWLWGPRCSSSSFSFLTCNMGLLKIAIAYLYQQSTLYLSHIHSFHPPWSSPQAA